MAAYFIGIFIGILISCITFCLWFVKHEIGLLMTTQDEDGIYPYVNSRKSVESIINDYDYIILKVAK